MGFIIYIPVPPLPILMDTHCFLLLLLFGGGGGGGGKASSGTPWMLHCTYVHFPWNVAGNPQLYTR